MSHRIHALKCWPGPFQAMLDGRKRFEWRKDDRGYDIGDVLVIREWDPKHVVEEKEQNVYYGASDRAYTGRKIRVTVTYILRGQFDVPDGYVVMGISDSLPE